MNRNDRSIEAELILDPKALRTGDKETRVYQLEVTQENLTAVPGVIKVESPEVTCEFRPLDDCIICRMTVQSHPLIEDSRTGKVQEVDCSDSDELTLSTDEERADILPDRRGRYDLKPSALALFFSSIPVSGGGQEFEPIDGDGYEVISEDEFERRKRSGYYSDNPFGELKKK